VPSIVAAPRKTRHSRLTRELFGEAVGSVAGGVLGEATIEVVEQRAGRGAIAAVACELGELEEVFPCERPALRVRLQSGADAKGIEIAGVGAGGISVSARQAVKDSTSKGIPVIRASRFVDVGRRLIAVRLRR